MDIAQQTPSLANPEPSLFIKRKEMEREVQIAVAHDEAFHFYYPENLELLALHGAKLLFFSPLHGEKIPNEADALYIGGGFPEEFAAQLAANTSVKQDIRKRIEEGLPVYAECGGYMYLADSIIDQKGNKYQMAGVIPMEVRMQKRLAALGYREVTALTDLPILKKGEKAKGHEFHYSTMRILVEDFPFAYATSSLSNKRFDGFGKENILAGYTHLHFASNPAMAARWIKTIKEYKKNKQKPEKTGGNEREKKE